MSVQQFLSDWSGTIASVLSLIVLLVTIQKKITKPFKAQKKITELLLWSRLQQEHDSFMDRGYCPPLDKQRLCILHKEYRDLDLNHLADDYERDIIELPSAPGGTQ